MKKSPFLFVAKKILKELGNTQPNSDQLAKMEYLLANVFIQSHILLDERLTAQEKTCLLLAAQGKTSLKTANLLNISKETVESHRKEIRRKLGCNSMAHAVYQGIRYGYLGFL